MTFINDINAENRYSFGRREYTQGNTTSGDQITNSAATYPQNSIPSYAIDSLTVNKLISGSINSKQITLDVKDGEGDVYIAAGKTDFTTTGDGVIIGIDDSDSNKAKVYFGNATNFWYFDGTNVFQSGTFVAGSLHIPDIDSTANSFHAEADGDTWWGCTKTDWTADHDNANAYILSTGHAKLKDVILSDNVIISGLKAGTEISIQGWQFNAVFSATDQDTVAWTSGTITLLDGATYTISAGNTGNISTLTYVYLDINISTTVLQTTTTASSAVGAGKILIAVAKNNTESGKDAIFQVFGGSGGINPFITADNIAANSITANEIVANTITGAEIASLSVSGKSCTFDTGTVGGWTMTSSQLSSGNFKINASNEQILIGSATAPLTGIGIFQGKDGSDYEWRVGDPAGSYIHWDGSTLNVHTSSTNTAALLINGTDITSIALGSLSVLPPQPWAQLTTDTLPYVTNSFIYIPRVTGTTLYMYKLGSGIQSRAVTSDFAAADAFYGAVIIGQYIYVYLRDNALSEMRVYRYDKDNLAGGGTQMTYAGFGTNGNTYMFSDGAYLYFTRQAGNTTNNYNIRRLTISGTTLTSASDFSLSDSPTLRFAYSIGADNTYIYITDSGDLQRKYNLSGTLQLANSVQQGTTLSTFIYFSDLGVIYGNSGPNTTLYQLFI